uniref:Thioesterase domain-containing protein n=1 Tax=Triticum urartu TaxID=4572 RepID=A0A8R7P673_TRIUA
MALLPVFEEYKNNRNPQSRRDPDGRLRRKRENYGGVASRTAPRVRRGRPAGQRSARPGLRVHPHHRERGPWPPRRHRNLLPGTCARLPPPPPPAVLPDHVCMYSRRDRLNQSLPSAWSQPFKILNGGVSALMAESTASIGGYMASGYRRVAGVQLSINHLKPARLGDRIEAKANPIQVGRNVQVWEVQIWLLDPATSEHKDLVSSARVTLLTNLSTPEEMKIYEKGIKKYAKL